MDEHNADETTFLTRYSTVRRYGTTLKVSNSSPVQYCIYHVKPNETLQGIALKFNITMTELRRINKLWNDSIILKSYIKVPIIEQSVNENLFHESSETPVVPFNVEPESVKDILSRIDDVIKSTAESVSKMERESSLPKIRSSSSNSATSSSVSTIVESSCSYQNIGSEL